MSQAELREHLKNFKRGVCKDSARYKLMTVFATNKVSQLAQLRESTDKLREQTSPLLVERNLAPASARLSLQVCTGRNLLAGWLELATESKLARCRAGLLASCDYYLDPLGD